MKPWLIMLDATVFEIPATGIAKATLGLYQACAGIQPGLRIVAVHRNPLPASLPAAWQVVREQPGASPGLWRRQVFRRLAEQWKPDFVHFPWNGDIPRLPRTTRAIMTLHDVLPLDIPDYFRTPAGRLWYWLRKRRDLARASLTVTDSDYSRGRIQQLLRPRRDPRVIYPSTLLPFADEEPSPERAPYYLYVGGYDARKGLEFMLRLFLELRRSGRIGARLLLTGTPCYFSPSFKALVQEAVSTGWVEQRGYLDDRELARTIRGARALIYPSRYEGFGLPPLEAMALGCPVLTTPCTALPEICGDAVLYADPEAGDDFARCWLELENRPDLRAQLAERGTRRATRFNGQDSARRFLEALHEVSRPEAAP